MTSEDRRIRSVDGPDPMADAGLGRGLAALDLLITMGNAGLNLSSILQTVLDATAEQAAMPAGIILLWDDARRVLVMAASRRLEPNWLPGEGAIPEAELSQWLAGRVFADRVPAFIADARLAADCADTRAVGYGAAAIAAVPLIAREQALGVLLLASPAPRSFSPSDCHILQTIGRQLAGTIENARLYKDASWRAEQVRLLIDLGQRLCAILDLDALLKAIVGEVQATFRSPLVALMLQEGEALRVAMVASEGAVKAPATPLVLPPGAGLSGWVAKTGKPLCVPDVTVDPRYLSSEEVHDAPIRSAVAAPIHLGGQLIGVLDLESERLAAFDEMDVALVQTVANQAAVAIGNARAYAQVGQQAATLRALLHTMQELNSTLDLRQLLEAIVDQVSTLIDVDSCIVSLLNPETGVLTPVVVRHAWADQVLSVTVKLGQGFTGHVAQTGVGEISNRADLDPRAITVPDTPVVPEALLATPLRYKGKVIGTMTLCRLGGRGFSQADLELVDSFASQASIAVENARLYTESQQHAHQLERAHARLLAAQNQLLQAEKLSAIGQLAAGMAHELNNPLTAIVGYAHLLDADGLNAAGQADQQRILGAADRAQRIVANLLAFAHQQPTSPQPVDLAALVERTLRMLANEGTEGGGEGRGEPCVRPPAGRTQGSPLRIGGVYVRQELAPDLPEVYLDPAQIEQLVVNLLRNAYRATHDAGGGTLTVRLSLPDARTVRLEVADEGQPIPADILPHIFDPFHTTGDRQNLGLSACFGIVRAHRGRIWAEPRPERGTTFIAELPVDANAGPVPGGPGADRPILIVTGDGALAATLGAGIEALGHRAIHVESAEAALAEIVVGHYDLLLCDVQLPGMSIERLYESARANDPALAARFVAVGSAAAAPAGVPTVDTPLDPARLQQTIAECLGAS